ncbi:Sexual differentiation process protein isp4 [Fusarium austroafricanum]|uniref:Sexual differentiation process protein isp4 n=1 Tax=Fusarium austroafricanum TaxID=2364996 RepID=A0A8H4NWW5_9HYPO|nr:Sexual differentiation process protein isp4 [Fusarium austroafricanum]
MAKTPQKLNTPSTTPDVGMTETESLDKQGVKRDLDVTQDDLLEAREIAATLSLEHVHNAIYKIHKRDPNFPLAVIQKIKLFLNDDDILQHPERHEALIKEIKIEAALITHNSPYAEVRAIVNNRDDPNLPCSTMRVWFIGLIFSCAVSFINNFFDIRQPMVAVGTVVPQLLAYPFGKFLEKTLPDVSFTIFGVRHSLNPGPFNKKEHMLITIMSNISLGTPYTNYVVWIQYLPFYFNQPHAMSIGYQILLGLSSKFIGYGLAGICRRFLVYPSFCLWPTTLVCIALNTALHDESDLPVAGPLKRIWKMSRFKFFSIAFGAMFAYFWLPNYFFAGLSWFSWMTWISPNSRDLATITGGRTGLGLNPFPTLDWNIITSGCDPLMVPFFTTFNFFSGALLSFFIILGVYYGNASFTSYLPVNSNLAYDHFGGLYNVSAILDERGIFDPDKFKAYSLPFLTAAHITNYMCFFAIYTAALTYGALYHHHQIALGFKSLVNSFRPSKKEDGEDGQVPDAHNRLMKTYREVPDWWYLVCLVIAFIVGIVGISQWPTNTTPAVVPFGIILSLIFVVPVGIIAATTGMPVSLNVIAEFLGGSFVSGNAIAMCFFKTFGYTTCTQAIGFCADLKLAHYMKIPPRFTFWAQMVPTLVSTLVSVGVLQYQMHLEGVCTPNAPYRFTCPVLNNFFTAAVLWGTIGPKKLFGPGGQYAETLVGFPFGVALVLLFWWLGRKFPNSKAIRSTHPVIFLGGGLVWAPYNLSYIWPAVPIGWFSWMYIKKRYLAFWAKYNYILSAAFSAGVALSALVMFFSLQYNNINLDWWGNRVPFEGCDGTQSCLLKTLTPGEYFGPRLGEFH